MIKRTILKVRDLYKGTGEREIGNYIEWCFWRYTGERI